MEKLGQDLNVYILTRDMDDPVENYSLGQGRVITPLGSWAFIVQGHDDRYNERMG